MEGMTIKEIAGICNVEKRTVELWAQKCEKSSQICEKISQAYKTKIPAHFTLEETIIIIKAGGRSTLADLLQENAAKAEPPSTALVARDLIKEMIPAMTAAIATAITTAMRQTSPLPVKYSQTSLPLPAASPDGEYYTIIGYGSMHGVNVNKTNAMILGREATKISRQKNIDIHKIPDERWGFVNSYHISVLQEVFTV